MLIEFSVGNFLSFQERQTLSLQATPIKDHPEDNPPIITERYKLLKGAILYGANSSGKSNLIKAMSTMRRLVLKSVESSSTQELDITPFLLRTGFDKKPSLFEVLFLVNQNRYRYGFEVDNTSVKAEWLYEAKKGTEKPLFVRENDGIQVFPSFKEGKDLEEKTGDNKLFLAIVDQFNGTIAKAIINWFTHFITISGLNHEGYKAITFKMLENSLQKSQLQHFYNELDLGFDDIKIVKKAFDQNELPKELPDSLVKQLITDLEGKTLIKVNTLHKKFNEQNELDQLIEFDMRSQESSGTNKVFNISGPIFDVLSKGGVLMIDELDASLHPLLALAIIRLFHSQEQNHQHAQLIITTHDTNLLSYGNYRRDQVYFIEKDQFGASSLYSLVEYKEDGKKIRKDRSFEKDYIQGKYGAVPYIGNFKTLLTRWQEK